VKCSSGFVMISSPTSLASPPRRFSSPTRRSVVYGDRFIPSRISSQLESGLGDLLSPNVDIENRPIHSLIRSELLGHAESPNNGHSSSPNVLRYQSSVDDMQRYASHVTQSSSPADQHSHISSTSPYRATSMPAMGSPSRVSSSFEPSSTSLGGSAKKPKRKISRAPYKVLDAPSLQDDFYLNLVDWSKSNVLSVALGNSVYLWSAYTSKVVKLHDFSLPESDSLPGGSVTSVCWVNGGTHIAVGTSYGRIQVWDAVKSVKVRELHSHTGRVGALSWNQQYCLVASGPLLSSSPHLPLTHPPSGSKDKSILLQDARIRGAFTPSRHLVPSPAPLPSPPLPLYPTPQRPSHPLHSASPDLRLHHPILSSRPSPLSSSATSSPFYSSPQRLLSSLKYQDGDEGPSRDSDEPHREEQRDDEFLTRFFEPSPTERSVRRRQTVSPPPRRRSSGMPPRPPSLPGTAERLGLRRVFKSNALPSRSVFGAEGGAADDMELAQVSDEEEEGERERRQKLDANESPLFGEMEDSRMEGSPSSTSARRLTFFEEEDEGDGGEGEEEDGLSTLLAGGPRTPPRFSSPHLATHPSPPQTLSDYLPQPTYLPQYGSPTSPSAHSPPSDHLMDPSSASSSPSVVHELLGHKQEVCGLRWAFDDKQLASGGNDNKLLVWNIAGLAFNERSQQRRASSNRNQILVPEHQFADHTAAVKAIAWSPHQSGLLVSGGGTADRHMRFWNTQTGLPLQAIDTGSQVTLPRPSPHLPLLSIPQVCNLMWSTYSNELVSTHGYSLNQIAIWKYPSLQKLATLTGHTYRSETLSQSISLPPLPRVLYLAMSPNGQSIVTGAGDETLRFWNVFPGSKSALSASKGLLLHGGGEVR
jgi:cell division cycle 20-like protein 1, cofactor of APC complex